MMLFYINFVIAVIPTGEISSTTDPIFTLKCNTVGAPAVVSWSHLNGMNTYTSDGGHQLSRSLVNGSTARFESTLAFRTHPYQVDTGERTCTATAVYISSNSSERNPSVAESKE